MDRALIGLCALFFDADGVGPAFHDHVFHKFLIFGAGIFIVIHAVNAFDQRQDHTDKLAVAAAAAPIIVNLDHGGKPPNIV